MFNKIFASQKTEKEFWTWFDDNSQHFLLAVYTESKRSSLFKELNTKLTAVHPKLSFLFSKLDSDGRRSLTISADGNLDAFSSVESLIALAPEMENWSFIGFRQPIDDPEFKIVMGGRMLSYSDVYYKYIGDEKTLGLQLRIRDYDGSSELQNGVYVLLDSLIGEYDTAMEINYIDWQSLVDADSRECYSIKELPELIRQRKIYKENI